ncbi:hypothetical protein SAMN05421505_17011 [Sinosporangium album]|uniref:Uncharacterized protein n=1 Tax=Sinosporangium album TaxID=504805 RepID=A0A1G8LL26_9ACTN|nr:hypothetical protein [Sinosporangium album]SDI56378.1 hypothetical protein SAMN05421505_17011 [Sinosporangium album]
MTAKHPRSPWKKTLSEIVSDLAAHVAARSVDAEAVQALANAMSASLPHAIERLDTAIAARSAMEALAVLAKYHGPVLRLERMDQGDAQAGSGAVQVYLPAVAAKVAAHATAVDTASSADESAARGGVERGEGLARRHRRILVQTHVFLVAFIALSGVIAANEELVDKLGLYMGGSALTIAWMCAAAVGKAFDKLYPENDHED